MKPFATVDDMSLLWRAMSNGEQVRASELLKVVSAMLRTKAKQQNRDLDKMIENDPNLAIVAKGVVVDVVARVLMTSTDMEPMTQMTQSAGGYSATGTFLVPGGGIYIKREELRRLGLLRPRYGTRDFYGFSD